MEEEPPCEAAVHLRYKSIATVCLNVFLKEKRVQMSVF